MTKRVYWQLSQGIWSPRDKAWGWRSFDQFHDAPSAKSAVRACRRDGFAGPMLLEKVEIVEICGSLDAPAWATAGAGEGEG